jgi:folate-dependent phosphoribosylglycinamide formyltransferase PurN
LHTRMQHVEHRLLPDVVRAWCAGRIHRDGRHVRIDE